jgi:hypothetical protein
MSKKFKLRRSSPLFRVDIEKVLKNGSGFTSTRYRNAAIARAIIAARERHLRETMTDWQWRKHRRKLKDARLARNLKRKQLRIEAPILEAEQRRRYEISAAEDKAKKEREAQRRAERLAMLKAGTLEPEQEDMPYWNHQRKIEIVNMEDIGPDAPPVLTEEEQALRIEEALLARAAYQAQIDEWQADRDAANDRRGTPEPEYRLTIRGMVEVEQDVEVDEEDQDELTERLEWYRERRAEKAQRRREQRAKLKAQHESAADAERALTEYLQQAYG